MKPVLIQFYYLDSRENNFGQYLVSLDSLELCCTAFSLKKAHTHDVVKFLIFK
jgi:hypothetical protein